MGTNIKKWMFPAVCAVVMFAAAAASAQQIVVDTAKVPFEVNVAATVKAIKSGEITSKDAAAKTEVVLTVPITTIVSEGGGVGVLSGARGRLGAAGIVSGVGKVSVRLSAQSYKNAEISLYAVNGKRVLRGRASAADAAKSVSSRNLTAGVYLLAVRGMDGNALTSRVTHRGGGLDVNVSFINEAVSPFRQLAKESADGEGGWHISVSAPGYEDSIFSLNLTKGLNPKQTINLRQAQKPAKKSFTETIGEAALDMVYVPGGTFTIGCGKGSNCPADADTVSGVKVSDYFISKGEVNQDQWFAVMGWYMGMDYDFSTGKVTMNVKKNTRPGTSDRNTSVTNITWYEALEFACKLSQKTGKKYRMVTEAEWEFAAKKYKADSASFSLKNIGSGEEWAYNSWNSKHSGGTDPIGPNGSLEKLHTQKTRRDAQGTGVTNGNITGRLIRSIEGVGPALRLAISADMDYPPGMPPTCDILVPELDGEPENSYRDMRWVTGGDKRWTVPSDASTAIGSFDLRVWEDGTAGIMTRVYYPQQKDTLTPGQWFTVNNMSFVFVPNSGAVRPYKYIFVTLKDASLICDMDYSNYTSGAYIGRIIKAEATAVNKPVISNLKSGAELAAAAGENYKMINMEDIPESAKKHDERILDGGPTMGWFQNNSAAGGVHHYRKDVDLDEFRFTVNQGGNPVMLANGSWFTVNNTFLRVTHSSGYTCDYLYAVTGTGDSATFYHNSFQGYERGDFRMFKKFKNANWPTTTCGDLCSKEIPKGEPVSMYATMANGKSTFVPAKCPAGGCK